MSGADYLLILQEPRSEHPEIIFHFPVIVQSENQQDAKMIASINASFFRTSARQRWKARFNFSTDKSYFERKAVAKQQRTQEFIDRRHKKEERKKRRSGSPRDLMKHEFREWWVERRSHEESLDRKAKQAQKDWNIEVAVVLERLPVVFDDFADWENDFDELKAYLAQFGKEYPKELVPERTGAVLVKDEELLAALPQNFRPASRETEADHSGKMNALDRKMKDRVFLVLDDGIGGWRFPQSSVEEGESLQDTARRIVIEQIGHEMDVYFPSSSPAAVLVRKEVKGGYFGTKKFFIRVQHDEGNVSKGLKHGWLDREEFVGAVGEEEDPMFYRFLL